MLLIPVTDWVSDLDLVGGLVDRLRQHVLRQRVQSVLL